MPRATLRPLSLTNIAVCAFMYHCTCQLVGNIHESVLGEGRTGKPVLFNCVSQSLTWSLAQMSTQPTKGRKGRFRTQNFILRQLELGKRLLRVLGPAAWSDPESFATN